ncbi:nuclear transport factor 2 family protein [Candidatus Cloacimonadota bacterium]
METQEQIKKLFESIDNHDVAGFLEFLSDDVHFKFGNQEPVNGKVNLRNELNVFFKSIKSISNDIINIWEQNDVVICRGIVTYTRHDNSILSVPFVNIFKMEQHLVKEYLIYADISSL